MTTSSLVYLTQNFPWSPCAVRPLTLAHLQLSDASLSIDINSALVGNITSQLKSYEDEDFMNVAGAPQAQVLLQLQLHLYPAKCSNVMNMMKALVTGFVDRSGE